MNSSLKYTLAVAVALSMTLSSYAVISVNWGAADATPYDDASGNPLAVGDLIEVGYFSTTAGLSPVNTAVQNLANFTAFGTGTIGDDDNDQNAAFPAGFGAEEQYVSGWPFQHQQIYMVAFNAPTAAAATQMGVWSVDFSSNSNWRFPADPDILNFTSIDTDDLTANPGTPNGSLAAGAHIWLGTPGTQGGSDSIGGLALKAVPEPSSCALVGVGLAGLIGLIRRRRR